MFLGSLGERRGRDGIRWSGASGRDYWVDRGLPGSMEALFGSLEVWHIDMDLIWRVGGLTG